MAQEHHEHQLEGGLFFETGSPAPLLLMWLEPRSLGEMLREVERPQGTWLWPQAASEEPDRLRPLLVSLL